ncbi:hypothetical protein Pla52o_52790 [Novipirellula galeiformis]|uniref:Tll0287-like domain-containing protein n=1 Tax=Novipirellula galeiformis TaxID=2528004 RepID=A0A5C6BYB8_9BACT|nr:DUF3365 domain-containing protein [Novipirellula galeiformis]TWU17273.1 hypothetical protein Pla52o_52790 [Novipirellula galeiformis]
MRITRLIGLLMICAAAYAAVAPGGRSDDVAQSKPSERPADNESPATETQHIETKELSVELARDRATVMQDVYKSTLAMLHDRYFHRDKSLLPARAMQDIFSDIEDQSGVEARWISASLKPMSVDHAPKSEFEKRAAKEIATGSTHVELVEDGYYRRALAIPLTGGCLSCHEGIFQNSGRKRFAGLVVSIPLRSEP